MITEDYVSFETAKHLKEKGFVGECIAYYSRYKDDNTTLHRWRNRQRYVNVRNNGYTLVPTLQMVMKWLREVHHIYIQINLYLVPKGYGADPVYSKLVNGIVGKAIARHFYELSKARKDK